MLPPDADGRKALLTPAEQADAGGRTDLHGLAELRKRIVGLDPKKIIIVQLGWNADESAWEGAIRLQDLIDGVKPEVAEPPPPANSERRIVANTRATKVNVRVRPGLAKSNTPVASLPNGTEIVVEKTGVKLDGYTWVKIAQGQWSGRYLAQELTILKK